MRLEIFSFLIFACVIQTAFADDTANAPQQPADIMPALVGGVNVANVQQCVAAINQACQKLPTWEQKNTCTLEQLADNQATCVQTQAIYQKFGMLPYRIQATGPVTVFTLLHIGDGQESFHIVDQTGAMIDLVDDQNPTIATNAAFQKIQRINPGAGVLTLVSGKPSESPQVVIPKALANKKGTSDVMQLIFPQYVKAPPCLACETVAVADIAYQFSYPEGKFLGVKWVGTEATSTAQPDVIDED